MTATPPTRRSPAAGAAALIAVLLLFGALTFVAGLAVGGGLPTRSFHRPISDYVNAFAEAGFVTDAMLELPDLPPERRPGKAAGGDARANAEIPIFLGLRAVRR